MSNYQFRDIKFYYQIHVERQKARLNKPVCYSAFTRRLKKMNLHDAIYTPRVENQARDRRFSKTPIEDSIRRSQTLKDQNIQVADLCLSQKMKLKPSKRVSFYKPEVRIPKPKKTIRQNFISFIQSKWQDLKRKKS